MELGEEDLGLGVGLEEGLETVGFEELDAFLVGSE